MQRHEQNRDGSGRNQQTHERTRYPYSEQFKRKNRAKEFFFTSKDLSIQVEEHKVIPCSMMMTDFGEDSEAAESFNVVALFD